MTHFDNDKNKMQKLYCKPKFKQEVDFVLSQRHDNCEKTYIFNKVRLKDVSMHISVLQILIIERYFEIQLNGDRHQGELTSKVKLILLYRDKLR